ncbi:MAG: hypothetical protein U0U09_08990 [Cyclobacteriaceae bacterium]
MKTIYAVLLFVAGCLTVSAQSFSELNNNKGDNAFISNWIHPMVRFTSVSPKYTEAYSGFTVNASFHINDYEKGSWRYDFENPTLGDMIFVLFNMNELDSRKTDQAFGSGFLGWHQTYVNVVATDRLLIAPGLSFGDYIFASKREDEGTRGARIVDPAGYFLHIGPAVKASYVLTNSMWVDAFATYDIGFQVGKPSVDYKATKGYPHPGFLNIGGKIHHAKLRLFGGIRITQLMDSGKYNDSATRVDISAGYMLGNR